MGESAKSYRPVLQLDKQYVTFAMLEQATSVVVLAGILYLYRVEMESGTGKT